MTLHYLLAVFPAAFFATFFTAFFTVFLAGALLVATFLAGAFLTAVLAGAFLAGAFFCNSFLRRISWPLFWRPLFFKPATLCILAGSGQLSLFRRRDCFLDGFAGFGDPGLDHRLFCGLGSLFRFGYFGFDFFLGGFCCLLHLGHGGTGTAGHCIAHFRNFLSQSQRHPTPLPLLHLHCSCPSSWGVGGWVQQRDPIPVKAAGVLAVRSGRRGG